MKTIKNIISAAMLLSFAGMFANDYKYNLLAKLVLEHNIGDYIATDSFFTNMKAGEEILDEELDTARSNYKLIDRTMKENRGTYSLLNEGFFSKEFVNGEFLITGKPSDHTITADVPKVGSDNETVQYYIERAYQPKVTTQIKKMKTLVTGIAAIIGGSFLYSWLTSK